MNGCAVLPWYGPETSGLLHRSFWAGISCPDGDPKKQSKFGRSLRFRAAAAARTGFSRSSLSGCARHRFVDRSRIWPDLCMAIKRSVGVKDGGILPVCGMRDEWMSLVHRACIYYYIVLVRAVTRSIRRGSEDHHILGSTVPSAPTLDLCSVPR